MTNDYERIRKNIEETWPDWKIQLANNELLISKHAKKLKTKPERQIKDTSKSQILQTP